MYHFIINPASSTGNGLRIWNQLKEILKEQDIEYTSYLTDGIGSASSIAKSLTENGCQGTIVVLGGDGTMNEVLSGMQSYENITLGYIPTGSSNDLARDLGIPSDPKKALSIVLHPNEYKLTDVGMMNTPDGKEYKFGVSMGIGYDAAICHEALHSKIKKKLNQWHLGKLTYLIIALKQLIRTKSHDCELILDDTRVIPLHNYIFVTVMVHKYEGGGFMFCPEADCSDGYLDICLACNVSKLRTLFILPTAFKGEHIRHKGIQTLRAKKVRIITDQKAPVHTDGESAGFQTEITMSTAPCQVRFIVA
ncbi:MAG: diacylglycerol kinase family lipid kinase [Clostridia bacterium]|nr:diacylglycerol kinase family lipid kinase [Clostridia bacterium]